MDWLFVALGGACGSALRYGLGRLAASHAGEGTWFPWGTFGANLLGSVLLAVIFVALEDRRVLGADARLLLGTGMMGGFTTYSTFNLETLRLLEEGHVGRGVAYLAATVVACLAGGALGLAAGRALEG